MFLELFKKVHQLWCLLFKLLYMCRSLLCFNYVSKIMMKRMNSALKLYTVEEIFLFLACTNIWVRNDFSMPLLYAHFLL